MLAVGAVPIYLSTTLTARAEHQAAVSPQRAVDTLSLAARVNPWAIDPLIVKSAILLDAGRPNAAVEAARRATRRDPDVWTGWAALADAERAAGNRAAAMVARRHERTLNPRSQDLTKGQP